MTSIPVTNLKNTSAAAERERIYQAVMHSEKQWREEQATNVQAGLSEMRSSYGL